MSDAPYHYKLRDVADLFGVPREGLTDQQRSQYAAMLAQLDEATKAADLSQDKVTLVLRQLAWRTSPYTGQVAETVEQLAAELRMSKRVVSRVLQVLEQVGLLKTTARGGRGKRGQPATPSKRHLTFLVPVETGATNTETHAKQSETHATTGEHQVTTKNPPRAEQVSAVGRAANGQRRGVEGQSKEGRTGDLWAHQLAKAAVTDWLNQQGLEGANNPEAVLRSRHEKAARAVEQLLTKEPRLREITPAMPYDWHELVTYVVCVCRDQEPSGYLITNLRKALEHLRNEQQPRPAVL
jgi:DNA-binding transcriptional ArsR family regulator